MNTLICMVCGILGHNSVQLPEIASGVDKHVKSESKIKQFKRFLLNKYTDQESFYLPFILPLLEKLSSAGELVFAIDGSTAGKECMVLMVSVIYKKRAIPIVWIARKGKKGHLPESLHCQLIEKLIDIVPENCRKTLLGDGEFDGNSLQALLKEHGWNYVLRTRKDMVAKEDYSDDFCLKSLGTGHGEYFFIADILVTQQQYGPVNLLVWHNKKYKEALYLLTNLDFPAEISRYYKKRFIIEAFFSDQKTKGFQLHRSRLDNPERIIHLLIAACLAYIFLLLVGLQAINNQLMAQIHRKDRCDWSLFTIGKRALQHLIDQRLWYNLSYNLLF
jgi:hypothetical protein